MSVINASRHGFLHCVKNGTDNARVVYMKAGDLERGEEYFI